jgi:hypothetical protein
MITRREVLIQFKRIGVNDASQLKNNLRDFEKYMAVNHGVAVTKTKKILFKEKLQSPQPGSQSNFRDLSGTYEP